MDGFSASLNSVGEWFTGVAGAMLVQSAVLIVVVWGLDLVLRKRVRAVVRYWVWMLVLVKLVLPPALSSPTGLWYWVGDRLPEIRVESPAPVEEEVVSVSVPMVIYEPEFRAPVAGDRVPVSEMVGPGEIETSAEAAEPSVSLTWQGIALVVWLVVVIAMLGLLVERMFHIRRLVGRSKDAPEGLVEVFEVLREQMRVRRSVPVRLTTGAASPSVCGLFGPTVLIPEKMAGRLTRKQLRVILLHELAHIKRGDLWVNLVQTLLQIVYFFHPLLWAANVKIRRIREQAVDETVLAAMGAEAEEYPRTLLLVSRLSFGRAALSLSLIGVVESKKALTGRIKHIVSRPFPRSAKVGLVGLLGVILIGAVLLPMAKGRALEKESESVEVEGVAEGVVQVDLEPDEVTTVVEPVQEVVSGEARAFLDGNDILDAWEANYGGIENLKVHCTQRVLGHTNSVALGIVPVTQVERIHDGTRYLARSSRTDNEFDDADSMLIVAFDGQLTKMLSKSKKLNTANIYNGIQDNLRDRGKDIDIYMQTTRVEREGYKDEFPNGIPWLSWLLREGMRVDAVKVRPKLERVCGELCHVVVVATDGKGSEYRRYWFAHEKGMLPLRVETVEQGVVTAKIECQQLGSVKTEVGEVWYPARARREVNGSMFGMSSKYELEVHQFVPHIKVSASDFELNFPPRTLVADYITGESYIKEAADVGEGQEAPAESAQRKSESRDGIMPVRSETEGPVSETTAKGRVLKGQVFMPDGKPAGDVEIHIRAEWIVGKKMDEVDGFEHDTYTQMSTTTDQEGQFTVVLNKPAGISDVPLKELRIDTTAWTRDYEMCGFVTVAVEKEPVALELLRMELREPGSAKIRVVGPDGGGITDARVVAERATAEANPGSGFGYVGGWRVTDLGDGWYQTKLLVPGAGCRLCVAVPGFSVAVLTDPFVPVSGECIDLETARPRPRAAEPNDIVLRLVDSGGEAVEGAQVGCEVRFSRMVYSGLELRWRFPGDNVSDESGEVSFAKDSLFEGVRRDEEKISLYVLHEERLIGAFVEIAKEGSGGVKEVTLVPVCKVYGRLESEHMEMFKRLYRTVDAGIGPDWRSNQSGTNKVLDGPSWPWVPFAYLLPPGRYEFGASIQGVHRGPRVVRKVIDVPVGVAELDIGVIELPASKVDSLVGEAAPEIGPIAEWRNGTPVRLADLKGKVVLLHLGVYGLGPGGLANLVKLHERFADEGLVIIGLFVGESMEDLEEHFKKYNDGLSISDVPFRIALDGGERRWINGRQAPPADTHVNYEVYGGGLVLIDQEGIVREHLSRNLEEEIWRLLGSDIPAWAREFYDKYRLDESEVLKRISRPYGEGRSGYIASRHSGVDPNHAMIFDWDGELKLWQRYGTSPESSMCLRHLIGYAVLGIEDCGPHHEYDVNSIGWMLKAGETPEWKGSTKRRWKLEGPLYIEVTGDWIIRRDAPAEAKARALEEIMAREFRRKIRLEKRTVERDVVVASKRSRLGPVVSYEEMRDRVDVFTDCNDVLCLLGGYSEPVGNLIDMPFLNEKGQWGLYVGSEARITADLFDEARRDEAIRQLLDNLSERTNLDFKVERREVDVWFLNEEN